MILTTAKKYIGDLVVQDGIILEVILVEEDTVLVELPYSSIKTELPISSILVPVKVVDGNWIPLRLTDYKMLSDWLRSSAP